LRENKMKKYIKIIGNIITVIAIIFVVKKLFENDIDYSILFNKENILPVIICTIILTSIVILNCISWKKLVHIISEISIPFKEAVTVYTKSNILKYLPGNVFQYVGRNELAINLGIRHTDVASATVLDVVMMVAASFLISLILLKGAILDIFLTYKDTFVIVAGVVIVIAIAVIIVVSLCFKDKFKAFLLRFLNVFKKKNIMATISCMLYYISVTLISSLLYMLVLGLVLKQNINMDLFMNICGAYTLSWLIGFITPGAPAGIGIKEAVMLAVTNGLLSQNVIVLSLLVLRILTIFGDILGFAIVQLIVKIKKT